MSYDSRMLLLCQYSIRGGVRCCDGKGFLGLGVLSIRVKRRYLGGVLEVNSQSPTNDAERPH